MAKTQQKASHLDEKQKHKAHKTIREKLRKRRQQQKQHMKQKKQHKKQYNVQEKRRQFFDKNFQEENSKEKSEFKYKKMKKYVEKFINIYQDDLEDFFELFKQFDDGGFIDISELQNKKLQKVLKKMFKYLPLKKNKNQYQKRQGSTLNLQNLIRNLVSQSIQYYLQNGTDNQQDDKNKNEQDDSSQDQDQKQKKVKVKKQVKINLNNHQDQGIFTLPVQKTESQNYLVSTGPMIPKQERQRIALLFEQQVKEMQKQKQDLLKVQDQKFDQIFGRGTTANKLAADRPKKKNQSSIQDVPDHLMAEGSAKIGQKVPMNEQQQNYDAIHRPKKLIQEHQQIMAINRGQTLSGANNSRKPFDRQRDVVNSNSKFKFDKSGMKNGIFFDFKDKMSAPKKSNNFL